MSVPRRIGLFGGTFDPPHDAHLALARAALDQLGLDRLLWIPAGQPWQKTGVRALTDAAHRAAMVELAIAGEPRFVLERSELERPGPSYTLDTVRELRSREPGNEWFLIIGQDQYARLATWHGWRELLPLVTLAVAARAGAAPQADPALAALPHRMVPIVLAPMPHASTALRAGVAPLASMVPLAVARYIDRHHLYSGHA
ncbi:MAG: nicotinate-nucleotide adenylyltransferase [Betaproteobacteria bacterium]